tara:strand:- start:9 stop:587 length:579 start_codon:yes stop_codon:yes gene_type:complete
MILTTKQIKQLIKEELLRVIISEGRDIDSEDPDDIISMLDDIEEGDLIYYGVNNLQKMFQILELEKADVQKEHAKWNKEYRKNQVLKDDPFWWDDTIYPLESKLADIDYSMEVLEKAIQESGEMFPEEEEGLPSDVMEKYSDAISEVEGVFWALYDDNVDEAVYEMETALDEREVPEELWTLIINHVVKTNT